MAYDNYSMLLRGAPVSGKGGRAQRAENAASGFTPGLGVPSGWEGPYRGQSTGLHETLLGGGSAPMSPGIAPQGQQQQQAPLSPGMYAPGISTLKAQNMGLAPGRPTPGYEAIAAAAPYVNASNRANQQTTMANFAASAPMYPGMSPIARQGYIQQHRDAAGIVMAPFQSSPMARGQQEYSLNQTMAPYLPRMAEAGIGVQKSEAELNNAKAFGERTLAPAQAGLAGAQGRAQEAQGRAAETNAANAGTAGKQQIDIYKQQIDSLTKTHGESTKRITALETQIQGLIKQIAQGNKPTTPPKAAAPPRNAAISTDERLMIESGKLKLEDLQKFRNGQLGQQTQQQAIAAPPVPEGGQASGPGKMIKDGWEFEAGPDAWHAVRRVQ